jgi:adenine/guanine phosphoribosyltransferase-like PRPP-binding protein
VDTPGGVGYVEHSATEPGKRLDRSAEHRVGRLSDVHARLSCFPEIADRVATLRSEMTWVMYETPHARLVQLWSTYGAGTERYLPLSLAPILDRSLIDTGIAVGWHGAPLPDDAPADLGGGDNRLLMGQLVHAAKQYDNPMWSTDPEDVQTIGGLAAWALASTRFGREVDLIASVPSSRGTNALPHQVARDLAFLTGIHYAPAEAIRFEREVPQVKAIRDYWTRRETVDGSMAADPTAVRSRSVLLVDDVCRSGVTFHECARACHRAGATRVTALAVSKTFEFQHIPEPRFEDELPWMDAQ